MTSRAAALTTLCMVTMLLVFGAVRTPAAARADNQAFGLHGHLVDTRWDGLEAGYSDIEVTITPQAGDTDYYYFANNVSFTNCAGTECIAYGGLQTNGHDGNVWIGKMAIFSIWNATEALPEPGGVAVPFSGEGVGRSVRLPYQWRPGVNYRLRIYLDTDVPRKLWAASVTDLTNHRTTRIGRIYAPEGHGLISRPVTFHERYGGADANCDNVPGSQVRFSDMTADKGTVRATSWVDSYVMPLRSCSTHIQAKDGDGMTSSIGRLPSPSETGQYFGATPPPRTGEIVVTPLMTLLGVMGVVLLLLLATAVYAIIRRQQRERLAKQFPPDPDLVFKTKSK